MPQSNPLSIVVVGASAAGLRAAARARRLLPHAPIEVIDEGDVISYGACGMPYFVSGDIENPMKLRETPYGLVRDEAFFRDAKGLSVRTRTRALEIDRKRGALLCKSLESGESFDLPFDRLVLALGASPVPIPGTPEKSDRVTHFKTYADAVQIRKALQEGRIGKVGIVGAGFIGCELAEAFGSLWGAEVVLIEAADQVLPYFLDREMALGVQAGLKGEGVELRLGSPVQGIRHQGDGVIIETASGTVEADHAVVAVGVRPNTALAAAAGLTLGERGGIRVDDRMTTSDPRIYAAGDCVEVIHGISKRAFQLPLGSLANRQGRVVGSNLGGKEDRFGPVLGSAAVKIFDLNVACTGLTEEAALQAGFDAACAFGTFTDRADYYPESQNIHLKVVFDRNSRRLLGLQGYGKGEVVKRVDVFAALLKSEGTLESLLDAEFAYAPPYAPALDPLFSLGCAAQNALDEGILGLAPGSPANDRVVVDIRRPEEIAANPLPFENPVQIPFETIRERWNEIPGDKPLLLICSKGLRSSEALRVLQSKDFKDAVYLGGGALMTPPMEKGEGR